MIPKCPKCGSDNLTETTKFDLTMISVEECHHDFECGCGQLMQIKYAPISVVPILTASQARELLKLDRHD